MQMRFCIWYRQDHKCHPPKANDPSDNSKKRDNEKFKFGFEIVLVGNLNYVQSLIKQKVFIKTAHRILQIIF